MMVNLVVLQVLDLLSMDQVEVVEPVVLVGLELLMVVEMVDGVFNFLQHSEIPLIQ
jgi:hypothetical protein